MKHYFVFDKLNTLDYQMYCANKNQFEGGAKVSEIVKIPGRNGTLSIEDGSFENVPISYEMYCSKEIMPNIAALRNKLAAMSGYKKLADSFDPDVFMRARYVEKFTVPTSDRKNAAFKINFDCDPRRFLKSGEKVMEFTAAGSIKNPTDFKALPMLRVYGTGTVTIGDISITITTADVYTDIDCEMQNAYKGSTNCNNNIELVNGNFPALTPGINNISLSTVSKVELKPRWWIR